MDSIPVQVSRRPWRSAFRTLGSLFSIIAAASLAGCATTSYVAQVPNIDGLPPQALNLRVMLISGCLPIAMGRKTETEVMPRLGLVKRRTFSWPMPSSAPHWEGNWRGLGAINTGQRSCSFTVFGPDTALYEQVTAKVLHDVVGVQPADIHVSDRFKIPQPGSTTSIPAIYSGCVNGVGFGYSTAYTKRHVAFDVSLAGQPTCPERRESP